MKLACLSILILATGTVPSVAQPPQDQIGFQAASVKPAVPGLGGEYSLRQDPGMIDWKNVPFLELVKRAYGLPDYQIKGPGWMGGWMGEQRYDIVAKLQPPNTPERLKPMLQRLLSDRFRFRFHYESQMIPGYRLTIAEGGLKMKESHTPAVTGGGPKKPDAPKKADEPRKLPIGHSDRDGWPILSPGATAGWNAATGQRRISVRAQSIEYLVTLVMQDTGLPVLDATNLKGHYDIDLQYVSRKRMTVAPEMLAEHPYLSIYTSEVEGETIQSAFRRQLGLNLHAEKVPFQVLVVDHADKAASAN